MLKKILLRPLTVITIVGFLGSIILYSLSVGYDQKGILGVLYWLFWALSWHINFIHEAIIMGCNGYGCKNVSQLTYFSSFVIALSISWFCDSRIFKKKNNQER